MRGQEDWEGHGRERDRTGNSRASLGADKSRHKIGIPIVVFFITALLAAALVTSFFYFRYRQTESEQEGLVCEGDIIAGDIPGKSREERRRELDAVVEEGMLAMTIDATLSGKANDGDKSINWLIENPSNQGKLIRVEVWQDEAGEKIYGTGVIPPGNYVERAPLLTNLPAGKYNYMAKFFAYKEDEAYIGQASIQIRLVLYE